ncbi:MAG TPA: response regulator, partial [Spirochaetia bacterium]
MNEKTDILIVDDSRTQLELLAHTLEQAGYCVRMAANGAEALSRIRENAPRLVISDIVMPVMDGYTMCRTIKDDDELRCLPVVLLTSLSDPTDVILGVEAGIDYYITKPYQPETLLERIKAILSVPVSRDPRDAEEEFQVTVDGKERAFRSTRPRLLTLLL